MKIALTVVGLAAALMGQPLKLPVNVDALSQIAVESVDVTMDANMIQFAERFLSDRDPDQAKAKRVLRGLRSIYVKSFRFARAASYSPTDVDMVRAQLQGPGWSRMVQAREYDENVEVFARSEQGNVTGVVVISSEPRDLTIVAIEGPLRPEDLVALSGRYGLPGWSSERRRR